MVPASHWSVRRVVGSARVSPRGKRLSVPLPAGKKFCAVSTTRESSVRAWARTIPETSTVRTSFPVSVSRTTMPTRWSPGSVDFSDTMWARA